VCVHGPEPPTHIAFARATVESIADADPPQGLDDLEAVLVGLGRQPWPLDTERNEAYPGRLSTRARVRTTAGSAVED